MVFGPEMARVIAEFQATSETKKADHKHHEQTKHTQVAFARDVRSLTQVIGEMGNPFCDDSKDLLVLYSRDLADPAVINTVREIEKLGQEQHDSYIHERLVNQTKPITDPIKGTTSLFSADLQSEISQEHSCKCRRTTAPCSLGCSSRPRYLMEI